VDHSLLLLFYVTELIIRFGVYRLDFFKSRSNTFDLLIVLADIAVEVASAVDKDAFEHKRETNLSILRVVRCVKALRVLRMFLAFRELFLILNGLMSALKAILWATFLIGTLLTIVSIVVVEYIHPLNLILAKDGIYNETLCPRCKHAFESVVMANLTFLQNVIAGFEETPVTVPLMERYPWTALVFIPLVLTLQLALLTLVVPVVCDAAQQSRLQDEHLSYAQRAEEMNSAKGRLLAVIQQMDRDNSGTLTKDELIHGFDTEPDFCVLMQLMDIGKGDMETVFSMLDSDGSGDVDYREWVTQINYMKNTREHTLLIFIKHFVVEIHAMVKAMRVAVKDTQEQLVALKEAWDEEHFETKAIMQSMRADFHKRLLEQERQLNSMSQQTPSMTNEVAGNLTSSAASTVADSCQVRDLSASSSGPCDAVAPAAAKPARCGLLESTKSPQVVATSLVELIRFEACADLQELHARLDQDLQMLAQAMQSGSKDKHKGAAGTAGLPALPILGSDHRFGEFRSTTSGANAILNSMCCQGPHEDVHKIVDDHRPSHPSAWSSAFAGNAAAVHPKVNTTRSLGSTSRPRSHSGYQSRGSSRGSA